MKLIRHKKWILFTGIALSILLIAVFIQGFVVSVNATRNNYTIRILEITDPTSSSLRLNDTDKFPLSELDDLQNISTIQIDTITMKRFVSLRENWDGKYDAIYIGKGAFSKTKVKSNVNTNDNDRKIAHNTTSVENDITLLKAKEIADYYIDKGLYVFLREETFKDQENSAAVQGNLYTTFNRYRTDTKSNIVFLQDKDALDTFTSKVKDDTSPYLAGLTQRPRLTLTNKADIISYRNNSTHAYTSGNTLNFNVALNTTLNLTQRPVRVRLFMNVDSSLPMTENNVVATQIMTSTSGTVSYKLPQTYSGPLYWRIEISDTLSNLKDFDSGVILYKGIKPVIKVLQVMPAGMTNSDLLKQTNMASSYLTGTASKDYELKITSMDMTAFNTYIANHISTTDKTSGLNGVYDMIIFGFQDMYDRVGTNLLSKAAADAVKSFAEETKQSLMLTHDTIFRDVDANTNTPELDPYVETINGVQTLNYWSSYFHDMVGQASPRTYLGGNAVNSSINVVPVNEGLLTQYPFDLDNVDLGSAGRYTVATTHDQFFPLNLERADVIPWYNISGAARDVNDSYNHFYTYSVGNITFSGTGHTNNNFPKWEQMLFVNTMYRAFVGANHAPEITVNMPTDNQEKPSYQDKLTVSYTVSDPDFKDKNLITNIQFKVGGQVLPDYTVKDKAIVSGETVTQTFSNPLPNGGTLKIEITARDAQGAETPKTITVPIRKVNSTLAISRSLSKVEIKRDEPVEINYSITPNNIPYLTVESVDQGIDTLVISNVKFEEKFPANLEISPNSGSFTKTGSLEQGYTISRDFGTITYQLSAENGVKTYVPTSSDPITFTLTAVPKVKQAYLLDNSKLSYQDIHALSTAGTFPGSSAPVNTLGIANDYSVFMLDSIDFLNSSFTNKGRMAAARSISITSFNVGGGLGNNPTGATIVAGGNLTMNGGQINGTAYYNGALSASDYLLSKTVFGKVIDFDAVGRQLKIRSLDLSKIASTGTTIREDNGNMKLTGNRPDLNVFNIEASHAKDIRSVIFDVPVSSTVVVNVAGKEVNWGNGQIALNNLPVSNLLFNFYEATTLNVNYHLYGTYLAPLAAIRFGGDLDGSIIGSTITGNGGGHSVNLIPFIAVIPDTSVPVRDTTTLYFSPLGFEAIVKITSVTLTPADILVGSELKMFPAIVPEDATNTNLYWISDNPRVVTVDQEGVIKGIMAGQATITATSRDGTDKSGSALIRVISPNLRIEGDTEGYVGVSIPLKAIYTTAMESVTKYTWTIKEGSNSAGASFKAASDAELDNKITLQATKSGKVTLLVTVKTDKKPDGAFTTEHTMTFTKPVSKISIDEAYQVNVGQRIPLQVVIEPDNADKAAYTWELKGDGETYAEIIRDAADTSRIELKGIKSTPVNHPITIIVMVDGNPEVRDTAIVTVGASLTNLTLPESIDIGVGNENSHSLLNNLSWFPVTMELADIKDKLTWSSSNPAVVAVSPDGLITGVIKGSASVTVIYKDDPTIRDTIRVNVINEDRY